MQLSVIILNYNVSYFLQQCVRSVERAIAGIEAEIIVVDNASTDDSCSMIRTMFPNVTLIANPVNSGFPKGNNIGVNAASGKYICILNPDTVVGESTFSKVLTYHESLENPGIIGVRLIDGRGNFLPESKRGVPTPFVAITKILGLYKAAPKLFGKYYASHITEHQSGKVDILVGAFMMMTRELYLSAGGFDEKCFMYSDDIDLSYTVLKMGCANHYFHETTVIHYKGESTVRDKMYMKRFTDAMDFFYRKHFRRSFVFDVFMKAGSYIFTFAKAKKVVPPRTIDSYILISGDDALRRRIEKALGKKVALVSCAREFSHQSKDKNTEIIFDADHADFDEIILSFSRLRHPSFTYKIAHGNSGFLIGSNSSNDRGEVLNLADYR